MDKESLTRAPKTVIKNGRSGFGLGTVLFIIFLILKLTGNIDWSWWWVTAPLWIPFAITIGVIILIFGGVVVFALLALLFERR